MEVRTTDSEVRIVKTPSEEFALFFSQTVTLIPKLEQRLRECPSNLSQIEKELYRTFNQGAGLIIAGMLNTTSKDTSVIAQVEEIRQSSDTHLRAPIRRTIFIRLLCGVLLQVTTLYCAPTGKQRDKTEARTGLYPELAAYGFAKKSSAAFEELVTRRVVHHSSNNLDCVFADFASPLRTLRLKMKILPQRTQRFTQRTQRIIKGT